jgi:hypothetical protein
LAWLEASYSQRLGFPGWCADVRPSDVMADAMWRPSGCRGSGTFENGDGWRSGAVGPGHPVNCGVGRGSAGSHAHVTELGMMRRKAEGAVVRRKEETAPRRKCTDGIGSQPLLRLTSGSHGDGVLQRVQVRLQEADVGVLAGGASALREGSRAEARLLRARAVHVRGEAPTVLRWCSNWARGRADWANKGSVCHAIGFGLLVIGAW